MPRREKTLTEFIIGEQRRVPHASGGFTALLNDVRLACKRIANLVGRGRLAPEFAMLRAMADEAFLSTNEWGGHLAAMASEAREAVYPIPGDYPRGRYLLAYDPLCGAPGLKVNAVAGSFFSVLRAPEDVSRPQESAFLQPGSRQVCAGYAIYGATTMLVLALESGVNGFTLDREIGEFVLTHPALQVPEQTCEFAVDSAGANDWEPAMRRYVDECLAGRRGPRGADFQLRWAASLVADVHRILLEGGVFLCPSTELLFEANPIAYVIERAGGRASSGHGALLEAPARTLHQSTALIFGSRGEVERIERYHRDHNERDYNAPLFGSRGLFRAAAEA